MLSPAEQQRYRRHLSLPEVGPDGQAALGAAKVLLVGAGGLGAPAAMYLAAAGVGTLGLVDHDRVELSNLQRQLLYQTADVGRPKLAAAAEKLAGLNPHVTVVGHETWLSRDNALDLLADYDCVLNGCDNFPTRYLLNDACVLLGKPCIDGSVHRFEGQVTVYDPRAGGPCYRCRFPQPPPPHLAPNCATAGVLGVLPGLVGTLQAAETLKLLLGRGAPLVGRVLMVDVLAAEFTEFRCRRRLDCPVCGTSPTITALIDYDQFCRATPNVAGEEQTSMEISVQDVAAKLAAGEDFVLLDVREGWEWDTAKIAGATLIPLGQLRERASELPAGKPVIAHCHAGVRSLKAAKLLRELGFEGALSMAGGIEAWSREVDAGVPRY